MALAVATPLGCIVTDQIEFEDEVNHPPQVYSVAPSNDNITTVARDVQAFTVTAWDPDEGDVDTYAGRIFLKLDPYDTGDWVVERSCTEVSELPMIGEAAESYGFGVLVSVACEIDLDLYGGVSPGDHLLVMVEVSDRGYHRKTPKEGARTADVLWVVEVAPDMGYEL